jgi:hypothetical protein
MAVVIPTTYGSIDDSTTVTTTTSTAVGIDPEVQAADAAAPLVDDAFDTDQTYYLRNGNHYRTQRWTAQRIWNLLFPLLIAGLLMGGAALYLFHDFSHLYPGQGNGSTPSYKDVSTTTTSSENTKSNGDENNNIYSTTTTNSRSSGKSKNQQHHDHTTFVTPNDDIGASCSLHPDCSMLTGNCCPTVDGKTLECCNP